MGRPPPTLVGRQDPVRVNLAFKGSQECRTRPRRQAPGVMRGMEQVGTDPTLERPLSWSLSARDSLYQLALPSGSLMKIMARD